MLIRKLFKFENAHIVRNCSSDRCRRSIHGHSYKVELILEAHQLDQGQMVYDFGLLKTMIRDLIDAFDHAICFWRQDNPDYIAACKQFSARWIELPVSPSAEQFSRLFFFLANAVLSQTDMQNGEQAVQVHSVIVHETDTGYAQCFKADVENGQMGVLTLNDIVFSEQILQEWENPQQYEQLKQGKRFKNPEVIQQVKNAATFEKYSG